MEPLRWVLLLLGVVIIALVFAYSRGLLPTYFRLPKGLSRIPTLRDKAVPEEVVEPVPEAPPASAPKVAPLAKDSKVVTARIMPLPGAYFPAEELILALRAVGLQHGQFDIFHSMADGDEERIRYSVASLVEPGSFDLSNLKDSRYRGISIFMVLPAPEDGVALFDDMLGTARDLAKRIDGNLVDEQGSAMSMQRERYMREEVIEFLRRSSQSAIRQNLSADS
jgi:cell division protein ZipA